MLIDFLKGIQDVRGKQGIIYKELWAVLYMCILSTLSGANSYRKTHIFIKKHFDFFKAHLNLKWEKPPAYNTLRDIIQGVDVLELEKSFRKYSNQFSKKTNKEIQFLACDGKVLRGSFDNWEDKKAIQLFSIFLTNDNIILAHQEIDSKENEIPVFQELIKELDLQGVVFTADAMHAQKKP